MNNTRQVMDVPVLWVT